MVWAALMVAVTLAGLSHRSGMLLIMVGLLVFYAVIGISANCLRKLLQQRRWPAWANFTAMVVLCILIFVVGMAGLFTAIPLMASSGLMEDREPGGDLPRPDRLDLGGLRRSHSPADRGSGKHGL